MSSLHIEYRRQIKESLGFWASWLPTSMLDLGDVVRIDKSTGATEKMARLDDFGIKTGKPRTTPLGTLQYHSTDSNLVALAGNGSGGSGAIVTSQLQLTFKNLGGLVFHAKNCLSLEVGDPRRLRENVLRLANKGKWDPNHLVVTTVVRSVGAVVVVSNSNDAEIVLESQADLGGAVLDVGVMSAGCTVRHDKGIGFQVATSEELTPLFLVSGVSRNFLGQRSFGARRFRGLTIAAQLFRSVVNHSGGEYYWDFGSPPDGVFLSDER